MTTETITAIATPPGKGGVGIVRISGPSAYSIAQKIVNTKLKPRHAYYGSFYDKEKKVIDEGITLYFKNPHSFTGEDVVELQGHGGPVILDLLLKRVIDLGARMARPGEFSERAFLNNKMDLTQAEAVADLINAESEQAARSAIRSLQGDFSQKIKALVENATKLRMYVEAAIDFPEEEIDFIKESTVLVDAETIVKELEVILKTANQGVLLRDGMTVVIAGPPNAGKSSLLNALSGRESAIVTEVAGTTRDVLREQINIDGMPLHIIDTAGLRDSDDVVEQEGIKRAKAEIQNADVILIVNDINDEQKVDVSELPHSIPTLFIKNKIDINNQKPTVNKKEIKLSAKTGQGLELLTQKLKEIVGYQTNIESNFIARRRHIDALNTAKEFIQTGIEQLKNYNAGELLAEDLRQAQESLSQITGEFTSDDLLGEIFSSFCIGK